MARGRGGVGLNPSGGGSMANDEHVAMLMKAVDAWNEWRDENPDIRLDLGAANLRAANLNGGGPRPGDARRGCRAPTAIAASDAPDSRSPRLDLRRGSLHS